MLQLYTLKIELQKKLGSYALRHIINRFYLVINPISIFFFDFCREVDVFENYILYIYFFVCLIMYCRESS
jgi:hypothetical protein